MERINATTGSYNFIDLFAGAGGLSEGFIQAGFSPVAHVEMNPYAAQTLETRTGYYYLKAQGKLDIYKDYISGKITRDEFLQHIPEEQLQSVFCETMSNETLPRIFSVTLTDGKLDATDPKDADRIVKILCDKGMTDPFEDEAMEVSSARKWI